MNITRMKMFSLFHAEALNSIQKGKSVASFFFSMELMFFVFVFVFNRVYHSLTSILVV